MSQEPWKPYTAQTRLPEDEVAVWRVDLDQPPEIVAALGKYLSNEEVERAGKFYFDYLTRRFIVSRGSLRVLLGKLLGTRPATIEFDYAKHGKPFLPGSRLRFNVSHAGELALMAVSHGREVGVDVEVVREMDDGDAIAKRFFSEQEVAVYLSLPPAERTAAFFRCWTRKEAYIKGIGDGLSHPLDKFVVTLEADRPAQLLEVRTNPAEVERWKMANLEPGEGYAGAVIAEGQDWGLRCYELKFTEFSS